MTLFAFKLLSRYPEVNSDNKQYYKLAPISAVRFKLDVLIKPTYLRIKNNGQVIYEEKIGKNIISRNTNSSLYFNIWLNLTEDAQDTNNLVIEMKFLGVYVPIKSLNYLIYDNDLEHNLLHSDSYINPTYLTSPLVQGHQLENEISHLPCIVRDTRIDAKNEEVKSILVMRLDQLGDFVLTVPAIIELKSSFPNATITIFVSKSNEGIAKSINLFDEVVVVPFSFLEKSNFRSLSQECKNVVKTYASGRHYNIAVDLSPMPESRELLSLISADRRFGFENTDTSMLDVGVLLHAKDPINWLSNVSHANYPLLLVDAIKRILRPKITHIKNINREASILSQLNLISQCYLTIHSGARNILVRWPLEKFIDLSLLIAQQGHNIAFFADDIIESELRSKLETYPSIKIVDQKITFDEFETIIANSSAFIGNDSGPKHLAALRDVPVISIHSPRTNWSEWGQLDSGYVISTRYPCAGCAIVTDIECGRSLECIKKIGVDEVVNVFNHLEAELRQRR